MQESSYPLAVQVAAQMVEALLVVGKLLGLDREAPLGEVQMYWQQMACNRGHNFLM